MNEKENIIQETKYSYEDIIVNKDIVKSDFMKKRQQESKDEIRDRRSKFIMDKWAEDFERYDYINYGALLELANRSDKIGRWFARVDAEFTATLTLPAWASDTLNEEDRVTLNDVFRKVNKANSDMAELKSKLSKKMKEFSSKIDEEHESLLTKAYNGSMPAFILTYPKNQLPIHLMLAIVKNADEFAKWREKNPESPLTDVVTPADFESNLLDSFRKILWNKWKAGDDIEEFLRNSEVDFYIPTKSTAPGHLSSIMKLIE